METFPKTCWICGKAVPLEDCKIDEHRLAVHENCYVARVQLEKRPSPRISSRGERALTQCPLASGRFPSLKARAHYGRKSCSSFRFLEAAR